MYPSGNEKNYLTIKADGGTGTGHVPEVQMALLRGFLEHALSCSKCRLQSIDVLMGYFACAAVNTRRAICAQLARAATGIRSPHHHLVITRGMEDNFDQCGSPRWALPELPLSKVTSISKQIYQSILT